MKVSSETEGQMEFVVGAHTGGCVTMQLRMPDVMTVVLFSLRPWPGYLVDQMYRVF